MKKRWEHAIRTLLIICLVLCAFYLREEKTPHTSTIPVERVLTSASVVTATTTEKSYRERRDAQRSEAMAALGVLAETDAAAAEALRGLIERAECERAVEAVLSAAGYGQAVCAANAGELTVCVSGRLTQQEAERLSALCAQTAGVEIEDVFILDECGDL